jgi:acetyl-CoA acetyltransferase
MSVGAGRSVLDGKAVVTGIGQSQVGRRLGRSGIALTAEACLRAIADAGLTPDDIDGVATYPGAMSEAGFSGASANELHDALGLRTRWHLGTGETAGQLGPVMDACLAVASGLATHVVCFRSVWESTAQMGSNRAATYSAMTRAGRGREWTSPFGAPSASTWIALYAQRYMHDFGLTREQLAQIALTCRTNAALNPAAVYRELMTMDDYLSARMISTPLCLFDCDVPCDGAVAVIVSRRDATKGLRRAPITVEAVGAALLQRHTWDQRDDLTTMAAHDSAAAMWEQTNIKPADVDIMELYDGFSYLTLQWIEAFGFCAHGEAGRFVEGGHRIALDGQLPLNTQGGQLSGGRLHGLGFLHEACVQMWREGGERQVAKDVEVAVAGAGGGPVAGCMLVSLRDGSRFRLSKNGGDEFGSTGEKSPLLPRS